MSAAFHGAAVPSCSQKACSCLAASARGRGGKPSLEKPLDTNGMSIKGVSFLTTARLCRSREECADCLYQTRACGARYRTGRPTLADRHPSVRVLGGRSVPPASGQMLHVSCRTPCKWILMRYLLHRTICKV